MKKFLAIPLTLGLLVPGLCAAADRFEEKDFTLDPYLDHYKRVVIAGVNKLARENPNCATIDPKSVQGFGGTPDDPEFVVTCGEPGQETHPHFTKTDITGSPSSDVPLDETEGH